MMFVETRIIIQLDRITGQASKNKLNDLSLRKKKNAKKQLFIYENKCMKEGGYNGQ